jgi:ComF family protein
MELTRIKPLSWLYPVIDFVFPPLCLGCGQYEDHPDHICLECYKRIDRLEHPVCLACLESLPTTDTCPVCGDESLLLYAHGHYQEPLDQIILQFKFHGITRVARTFGEVLVEQHGPRLESLEVDLLIPIALHPGRENRRGYNQAALLARTLSDALKVPLGVDRLQRVRRGHPQARMQRNQRADNIRGAFRCAVTGGGQRVLLIDDVVTTGSTVTEAARVLERGGYEVVGAVAIAHGG